MIKYILAVSSFVFCISADIAAQTDTLQQKAHKRNKQAIRNKPDRAKKDFSNYRNIFDLIRSEIHNVKVEGTHVFSIKGQSFSLSAEVLYDVDGMIVTDISFVRPAEVERIEYIDDAGASAYGMNGSNGIIKIWMRKI
jgi:hypothetical protein